MRRTVSGPGASHWYSGVPASNNVKTFHDLPVRSFEEAEAMIEAITDSNRVSDMRFTIGGGIIITKNVNGNVALRWCPSFDEYDRPEYIAVVLYRTEIVRFYKDGTFSVDNGGYATPTTSSRVNQFTPRWFRAGHVDFTLCVPAGHVAKEADFRRYAQGWVICTHNVRFPVNPGEGMVD